MIRIKEILKERGMSVSDLALLMGVCKQSLYPQINGHLLVDTAEKIAAYLGVETWELFADREEVKKQLGIPKICPHCGKKIKE